jgi:ABC-type transporter Mla maintaining outer membrane lipid asymmetry permease subunit MlaE
VREFAKLGLTRSVGGVLALALARELTPVVTAIILAGRVGSAFAAELGTMQVSGVVSAYVCMKMRVLAGNWCPVALLSVKAQQASLAGLAVVCVA